MFPIVPYSLSLQSGNGNRALRGYLEEARDDGKLQVPKKVTATTHIAHGSMTVHIDVDKLRGRPDNVQISVIQNTFGTLELDSNSKDIWSKDTHWVRALKLSNDCHNYNVQLRLQPTQRPCSSLNKNISKPKLILQTVRQIEVGQELLLWFSEDILAMLQIAFLTPANIQGQKKYVCTKCLALYEFPNPLKLHITLSCGRYDIYTLWEKLANILSENPIEKNQEVFDFKLSSPPMFRQKCAMDLSTSSASMKNENSQIHKNLYRPYSAPSAFIPFKKITNDDLPKCNPAIWPVISYEQELRAQQEMATMKYDDDAQIESLVSSLGKSKDGHVCLYCGKCYSRKYGLKIHIRTHTGYKPLKCKFCMRPFGDPSNLNKHVRLHAEGNTPYKCDLCGKILVRRRDLERHLKSRHMIEMHPGVNILADSITENLETSDDDQHNLKLEK